MNTNSIYPYDCFQVKKYFKTYKRVHSHKGKTKDTKGKSMAL